MIVWQFIQPLSKEKTPQNGDILTQRNLSSLCSHIKYKLLDELPYNHAGIGVLDIKDIERLKACINSL